LRIGLGADYDALYAAIEQCDVFICVLDKLIYTSQAFCPLIHACSLQRRRTTQRRLVTSDSLNYVVLFSPRVRHFKVLIGPKTGLAASDYQHLSAWSANPELEPLDLNRLKLLLEDLPPKVNVNPWAGLGLTMEEVVFCGLAWTLGLLCLEQYLLERDKPAILTLQRFAVTTLSVLVLK
jgi:hypothetical protein